MNNSISNSLTADSDFLVFEKIRSFINWPKNCQTTSIDKTKVKLMQNFAR